MTQAHLPSDAEPPRSPLKVWPLILGGALLAVGLVAGYVAGARGQGNEAKKTTIAALPPERIAASSLPAEPAPAAEILSAEEARNREVTRLVASGPDPRNLRADALRVGQSWSDAARREGVELKFADWTCYRAGCMTNIQHAPEQLDRLTRAISMDRAFVGWAGEKFRSGPIGRATGKVEVTWILYAPPDGEPALTMAQDQPTAAPSAKQ